MPLLLSQGCQGYNNPQSSTKGESRSHPADRCRVKQTDQMCCVLRTTDHSPFEGSMDYTGRTLEIQRWGIVGLSGLFLTACGASSPLLQFLVDLAMFTLFMKDFSLWNRNRELYQVLAKKQTYFSQKNRIQNAGGKKKKSSLKKFCKEELICQFFPFEIFIRMNKLPGQIQERI